jgi:hypothetical protein
MTPGLEHSQTEGTNPNPATRVHRCILTALCFILALLLNCEPTTSEPACTISGYVTDRHTQAGIQGCVATIQGKSDHTASDGHYRISDLDSGHSMIEFQASGYHSYSAGIDIGDVNEVFNITLEDVAVATPGLVSPPDDTTVYCETSSPGRVDVECASSAEAQRYYFFVGPSADTVGWISGQEFNTPSGYISEAVLIDNMLNRRVIESDYYWWCIVIDEYRTPSSCSKVRRIHAILRN